MSTFSTQDWDQYAACYDSLLSLTPYTTMIDQIMAVASSIQTPILDAGCGTGNITSALRKKHGAHDIVAFDASKVMIEYAREKVPGVPFIQGTLDTTLPLGNATFGSVICINVLYAVQEPFRTLREFMRILRPDGKLILVTPRKGYENGYILRQHAQSKRPYAHWRNLHHSMRREHELVHEAIQDTHLAERFLQLVRYNRTIAETRTFHFFTPNMIAECVHNAGFRNLRTVYTYAQQNILVTASKRSSS